ncbi:succinate dehydrogenase [Pseudohoeflea coraliihabitans]|uniref:Succinate dehydrogenase n=1 Tax=Pseudohoeflea coraliihabitans TaxID=2860393 RepID=A0ABS6WMZ2_9HYPH|nr:succinate dehydrogenase [Pseudohoeflea sp. DP4N28-3]MBW3096449.1 succinate dehydrogenase [Pseudohoeflea sp. DP4N28-3]
MLTLRLYMLQRLSALVMAPLTLGHIATMIYAIQGGLSAEEILSRTRGSVVWMLFYGSFVVAVSLHAAIGLRVIIAETFAMRGRRLDALTLTIGLVLLVMGMRAVYAVTAP